MNADSSKTTPTIGTRTNVDTSRDEQTGVGIITGASRGFGRALAQALVSEGWALVIDARDAAELQASRRTILDLTSVAAAAAPRTVVAVAGDIRDAQHRSDLIEAARSIGGTGGIDLVVNNASLLGPSPQPALADYPLDAWTEVYDANVRAPLALVQATLADLLSAGGVVVNITSDAAVEPYEGWGGYGSSKAALEHWTRILAAEQPQLSVYAFDPGDMRTQMHQDAFPGEDISDRPSPESVVPALLRLLRERRPSGRYRASDLLRAEAVA
jgi:NAD(P)-dependent dehydrogenase (short-subunit alcohol dehydrogenase family)